MANNGTKQVVVGCKLATGLIMELITPPEQKAGLLPAPVAEKRVWLQGANQSRIARTNPSAHKFGITYVDEEFANEWFRRNKDLKFVKTGAVFIVQSEQAFKSEAKDRVGDLQTGIEPIDPLSGKDPRMTADVDKAHLAKLAAEKAETDELDQRRRLGVV